MGETRLNPDLRVRIEKVGPAIARVYFLDNTNVEVGIPHGFAIFDRTNNVPIQPVIPGVTNFFIIAWTDSYDISFNNQPLLALDSQRQWEVRGPLAAEYSTIQQ
ncbi:hypothetical protein HK102_001366 [Quaeritorhiza haematococci]|nr:hypothetical protein HK102_001366 [Quaeritorhiza haematococci]